MKQEKWQFESPERTITGAKSGIVIAALDPARVMTLPDLKKIGILLAAGPEAVRIVRECMEQAADCVRCMEKGDQMGAMVCLNVIVGMCQTAIDMAAPVHCIPSRRWPEIKCTCSKCGAKCASTPLWDMSRFDCDEYKRQYVCLHCDPKQTH